MNLRDVQAPIKRRYEEEPGAAQITMTVRSAPSDLSDPLHCAVAPDAVPGLAWRSGAHPGVGGAGDVACSGDLLMGALAACQEVTLRMVAAAMGIELEALEVEVSGHADLRGTLAMSRDVRVGVTGITCTTRVKVKQGTNPERARRLLENAERYCVVLNTLRDGVAVESDFTLE